jgi:hypothetical protein
VSVSEGGTRVALVSCELCEVVGRERCLPNVSCLEGCVHWWALPEGD